MGASDEPKVIGMQCERGRCGLQPRTPRRETCAAVLSDLSDLSTTLMLRNLTGLTRNQQRSFSTSFLCVPLAVALLALAAFHCTRRRPDSPAIRPKMRVVPVPVRSDNYACEDAFSLLARNNAVRAYAMLLHPGCTDLLIDDDTKTAAAVDPYDVKKGVRLCSPSEFFVKY